MLAQACTALDRAEALREQIDGDGEVLTCAVKSGTTQR
jgi:hypothetical protein